MASIITTIQHPYWTLLGAKAYESRTQLGLSQAKTAMQVGVTVSVYAAMESGFVPPHVESALVKMDLEKLDTALGWDEGTASGYLTQAVSAALSPSQHLPDRTFTPDRSNYSTTAWARLGKAVQTARLALHMSRGVLGYAIKSTSKTVMRLEEGRVYGDPRTAPPGDYNSEKYMFKRLALIEMALEWDQGLARAILDNTAVSN